MYMYNRFTLLYSRNLTQHCKSTVHACAQSCLTLCNPMDCSPPCSSVHGIFQARVSGWVAIPFSRGSSQPRDQTEVSYIGGRLFTIRATREASLTTLKLLTMWITAKCGKFLKGWEYQTTLPAS